MAGAEDKGIFHPSSTNVARFEKFSSTAHPAFHRSFRQREQRECTLGGGFFSLSLSFSLYMHIFDACIHIYESDRVSAVATGQRDARGKQVTGTEKGAPTQHDTHVGLIGRCNNCGGKHFLCDCPHKVHQAYPLPLGGGGGGGDKNQARNAKGKSDALSKPPAYYACETCGLPGQLAGRGVREGLV